MIIFKLWISQVISYKGTNITYPNETGISENHLQTQKYHRLGGDTVDGSEILRSPVEGMVVYPADNLSQRFTRFGIDIWVFPKIGVPQNGWFIMENPIKMEGLGVPLFLETPIYYTSFSVVVYPKFFTLPSTVRTIPFHESIGESRREFSENAKRGNCHLLTINSGQIIAAKPPVGHLKF